LPEGYAVADLNWPIERYRQAREELVGADLITFDDPTEIVVIQRWFKHNPPMNEKHLCGIFRLLERLPCSVREVATEAAELAWRTVCAEKETEAQKRRDTAQAGLRAATRLETRHLNGSRPSER
jgi:hypothetical protein